MLTIQLIISLVATIIKYAFYATIWYAAICIIRGYKKHFPPKNYRQEQYDEAQKELEELEQELNNKQDKP